MLMKISVEDALPNETSEEICLHNLKITDLNHNLQYFIVSVQGWFNLNPTKNYQDLEKFLRENNFNTHLYCAKPRSVPNSKLVGRIKDVDCEYECIYSCRPKNHALEEVLKFWSSYEENFEKLKYAGMLSVENIEDDSSDQTIKFNEDQMNTHELISKNRKKIKFEKLLVNDFLRDLDIDCKNKYGKGSVPLLFAIDNKGSYIFAMTIDNEIISNIGYRLYIDEDGTKKIDLVDLAHV